MNSKLTAYRNRKLLDVIREAPECFLCGKVNDGTIVPAHSNRLMDGKGTGIKAHDYRIAALCQKCHAEIDNGKNMDREHKIEAWEWAHRKTIGWLIETGRLVLGQTNGQNSANNPNLPIKRVG